MKKICFILLLVVMNAKAQKNKAAFEYFEYKGKDAFFDQAINLSKQYFNPIVAGFYPDPSICRKGNEYYLVNSSFSYFPGIPIWKSKDLISWKQLGHVLDKPSQLQLDGLDLSAGIYAPTIRYNEHNNTFYLICTVVGALNNFIVTSKDPSKGWSEPIALPQIKGIDPSLFFDESGKAFITHCGSPKFSLWRGHKAIYLSEFDIVANKVVGESSIIINGGVDTASHPMWLEGPHIYKVKNKYYLIAAEGGTSENHSQVAFESEKVEGPYKACMINPILTQRNLSTERPYRITSAGHVDLVKTKKGDWWAVFLATRPYSENYYNTGRETFLLPVVWKKNIPVVLENGLNIPSVVNKKGLSTKIKRPTGNFFWRDDFDKKSLAMEWNMLRTPREEWYKLEAGKLVLNTLNKSIYDKVNPAFLGRRQQHISFTATTQVSFQPKANNELAGLVLFQSEKNNIVVGKCIKKNKLLLVVENRKLGINETLASIEISKDYAGKPIVFKINVENDICNISYGYKNDCFVSLLKNIDIKHLSTKISGGFVGTYVGIYTTSIGGK